MTALPLARRSRFRVPGSGFKVDEIVKSHRNVIPDLVRDP
jgi:hypothetical protein